jgi:uncharacterized RDD family membrane protein YckC
MEDFVRDGATNGEAEQTSSLAPRLKRLWAALVDLMVLGLAMSPGIVLTAVGDSRRGDTFANVGGLGAILLQWSLICQTGQSFGKRMFGLRIVKTNGQPVDKVSGVALRTYWLVALFEWKYSLIICVVDVLLIFGRSRRCLHDITAGTKVIEIQS